MPEFESIGSANRTLRERLGGASAITLRPFLWTSIITVGFMPLASLSSTVGVTSLAQLIALSAAGWLAFGAVIYLAGITVLRNREKQPVHLFILFLVGITAGLTRSFIMGDWISVIGIGGDHNFSKVTNAALSGAVWIFVSAAVMDSKLSYQKYRDQLIAEQTRLITLGDEWLGQVRAEQKKLAESVHQELASELESTRSRLHALMSRSYGSWNTSINELVLFSGETTHSLSASIKRIPARKSGINSAFETITAIPLLDGRWAAIVTSLVGVLPVIRLTSLGLGLTLVAYAAAVTGTIPLLGKRLIHAFPARHKLLYALTCAITFIGILLTVPIMLIAGLDKFSAIAFGMLGATLTISSLISFSLISLTQVIRRQDLKSMQEQNAMLEILESATIQMENTARIELTSYLASSIQNALKAAANAIEDAIRNNNDEAVNSGLAVLDAISSNILGRYTSDDDINFRQELASLAKPWSNQAIITWTIETDALDREVIRRALLVIAQCFSHLLPSAMANRIHVNISGTMSHATLVLEINAPRAWIDDARLTQDVLDASTYSSWSITGSTSTSELVANIGR